MGKLHFVVRSRSEDALTAASGHLNDLYTEEAHIWDPARTAAIICDMWDRHWCQSSTARAAAMAPRMNQAIDALRQMGVLIIHAPSNTMSYYDGHPARERAKQAPPDDNELLNQWANLDLTKEAPLPIDDSDGGCDCKTPCRQGSPWTKQMDTIEIREEDAITDSGEAVRLMRARGIDRVLMFGVATNMCVLGRPFGIRRLREQGFQTLLVRDMTDSMYNPAMPPYVSHDEGTDLVIRHIEQYWCPTVTSDQIINA